MSFERAMEIFLYQACTNAEIMQKNWPEKPRRQARYLADMANKSLVLVNLVPPSRSSAEMVPMFVKGSMVPQDRDLPQGEMISTFVAPNEWGHLAWRLAYGDQRFDVISRELVEEKYPGTLKRLPRWLTPAGIVEYARLRGDHSGHRELEAVDWFEAAFRQRMSAA